MTSPLTIADGDGGTVLAEINAAIARLANNSLDTARPSDCPTYGFWSKANTPSTGITTLYQYDGTNDVPIWQIDTAGHTVTWLGVLGTASATAYTTSAANVNNQTGTAYTLQPSDNGKTVTMNNAGASTLTVASGLPAGFSCAIVQLGAGQVTITPSSTTVRNKNGLKLAGQYSQAGLLWLATDTYSAGGDLST